MLSEKELKTAIHRLLDYKSGNSNFTAQLYQLMAKADSENKSKLQKAFPVEAQAYELWFHSENEKQFFADWGIELPEHLDESR